MALGLSGCVAPYQIQSTVSPKLTPCRYKTYAFLTPEDLTLTHWIADPEHRKVLEDLLRSAFNSRGLTEATGGNHADLYVKQRLETRYNAATQTTEGVVMASDYKLAKWRVELVETPTGSQPVWSAQMDAVIGDVQNQNRTRARNGIAQAVDDFPLCR